MQKYQDNNFTSKYGRKYTIEFKHFVCQEYLKGTRTRAAVWREYIGGDGEHGNLSKWLRDFGYLNNGNPASIATIMSKEKSKPLGTEESEKRIKELETSLEDCQLQLQMYKRMIEMAEEELKINIRKKSNTK